MDKETAEATIKLFELMAKPGFKYIRLYANGRSLNIEQQENIKGEAVYILNRTSCLSPEQVKDEIKKLVVAN